EPRGSTVREVDDGAWAHGLLTGPPAPPRPLPPLRRLRRIPVWLWLGAGAVFAVFYAVFPIWWIFLQAVRPVSEDALGNPFWTWSPTLAGFEAVIEGRLVGIWLLNTAIMLIVGVAITVGASVLAGYALGRLQVPGRRWIARLLVAR